MIRGKEGVDFWKILFGILEHGEKLVFLFYVDIGDVFD